MFRLIRKSEPAPVKPDLILDLSGPRLRKALENLIESAEPTGGVERYVGALALKASLFEEILGKGRVGDMEEAEFLDLASFITPVRRRIGPWLAANRFETLRQRIAALLDGWSDLTTTGARLAAFTGAFPEDREHRWVRDLGAEILHFIAPDRYPLMTRWVWDRGVGTGVLREIWFADDVDTARIDAADDYATFATLSGELEDFLKDNGFFRDLPFYSDLLMAHVYAGYINDRGGQYLRSDFTTSGDPMAHTRRMLGLDAVNTETGRTRLKLIDGTAHVLGEPRQVAQMEPS
ncbi:hypothetical protein [Devosia sp.]|uniref:hypothetical protein n=1 Tax=Devosia sp. TaxID=1871048 RepID=UPI00273441D9|nr:hypothetical protein [Devosia sp.]MDP2780261.1 hypothetical protein [Devosia sp.]